MNRNYLLISFSIIILNLGLEQGYCQQFKTESLIVNDICFSKSGKVIAATDKNMVKVFNSTTGELIQQFEGGHSYDVLCLDLSTDSTLLASGDVDGTLVLWNLENKQILKSLTYHNSTVTSVKISTDSNFLLSGDSEGRVLLVDIKNDKILKELHDHSRDIASVILDPGMRFFATAGGDSKIRVYDMESKTLLTVLELHKSWIRDLAISQDGSKMISCGDDKRVITWDLTSVQDIFPLSVKKLRGPWITSVDLTFDAAAFVVGKLNGQTIMVADYGNIIKKGKYLVNEVLFMPGETQIFKVAIATRGNGVQLFRASEMKLKNN